jgi:hypothetical protein
MTTIDYTLTTDQLSNAVYNTVHAFDEYTLRKRPDKEERQIIMDSSWNGMFSYFISEIPGGSSLTLEALASKTVSADKLSEYESVFLKNLYRVIDKEVTIRPDIVGKNILKNRMVGKWLKAMLWIMLIVFLILRIIQWYLKNRLNK